MDEVYVALDDRLLRADGPADAPGDWTVTDCLTGVEPECLAVDAGGNRLFVGTVEAGLQRSTDGGDTWAEVGDFDDSVTAVTVSPHDADVVWAGTEPSKVYRSNDGGDTWTEFPKFRKLPSSTRWSFPPHPQTHHVRWLEVDRTDPGRLYVAVEAGAFVRAEEDGQNWHDHPNGARRDNHAVRTHPDAPGRVYVAAGDGYAQSPDGGQTWDYPEAGLDHGYVWGLAVDPGDPDRVFVSAAAGAYSAHRPDAAEAYLYRREDERPWQRVGEAFTGEGAVRAVLAAPRPGVVYAVTNLGLWRSRNGGDDWQQLLGAWSEAAERRPQGIVVA
ncbi:WD40/YVTN/BNR-like repeat-containing protein [Halobacteriales archaeon Cl-PHB]